MMELNIPKKSEPSREWIHYPVWNRVRDAIYSLPNYFETDLVIKGVNVTELFSVGSLFSSVVESQVVAILNSLRNLWDPDNKYAEYAFIRQSQTFPDVLLASLRKKGDILFGIELKSWYVLSKEGEPSFRYTITPEACAEPDLLVTIPWMLSDVISGSPKLLSPYMESARYVAEYRNYYWERSRIASGKDPTIRRPPKKNRRPYPDSKQEASDEAQDDKGRNFGRIARAGILDEYVESIKNLEYLGIKIRHWIAFFKAMVETKKDEEIEQRVSSLANRIGQGKESPLELKHIFLEVLDRLRQLWEYHPVNRA